MQCIKDEVDTQKWGIKLLVSLLKMILVIYDGAGDFDWCSLVGLGVTGVEIPG